MDGFCRACLAQVDDSSNLYPYSEKNRRLFVYSTGLQVKRNDNIIFQICKDCYSCMKNACSFKKNSRHCDRKLRSYFALKEDGDSTDLNSYLKSNDEHLKFRLPLNICSSTPANQRRDDDNESTCTSIQNFMTDLLPPEDIPDNEAKIIREVIEEEADILEDSLDSHWLHDDSSVDTDFRLDFSCSPFATPRLTNDDHCYTPVKRDPPSEHKRYQTHKKVEKFLDSHYGVKDVSLTKLLENIDSPLKEIDAFGVERTGSIDLNFDTSLKKDQTCKVLNLDTALKQGQIGSIYLNLDTALKKDHISSIDLNLDTALKKGQISSIDLNLDTKPKSQICSVDFNVDIEEKGQICSVDLNLDTGIKEGQICSIDLNLDNALKKDAEYVYLDRILTPTVRDDISEPSTPLIANILFGEKDEDLDDKENEKQMENDIDVIEEFLNVEKDVYKTEEITEYIEVKTDGTVEVEKIIEKEQNIDISQENKFCITNFYCNMCNKQFGHLKGLKIHSNKYHKMKIDFKPKKKNARRKMVCDICGKIFHTPRCLIGHLENHNKPKSFSCKYCPLQFSSQMRVNMHVTTHTGVPLESTKEMKHVCTVCGKSFASASNYRTHVRRHDKSFRHACEECGMSFYRTSDLNTHMRRHTGARPFPCSLCLKTFSRSDVLNRHMKRHTGERPFPCNFCSKQFANGSELKAHQKNNQTCIKLQASAAGDRDHVVECLVLGV